MKGRMVRAIIGWGWRGRGGLRGQEGGGRGRGCGGWSGGGWGGGRGRVCLGGGGGQGGEGWGRARTGLPWPAGAGVPPRTLRTRSSESGHEIRGLARCRGSGGGTDVDQKPARSPSSHPLTSRGQVRGRWPGPPRSLRRRAALGSMGCSRAYRAAHELRRGGGLQWGGRGGGVRLGCCSEFTQPTRLCPARRGRTAHVEVDQHLARCRSLVLDRTRLHGRPTWGSSEPVRSAACAHT